MLPERKGCLLFFHQFLYRSIVVVYTLLYQRCEAFRIRVIGNAGGLICPEPVIPDRNVDIRHRCHEKHILVVHAVQQFVHHGFQAVCDAVIVIVQKIVGADLQQNDIRIICLHHISGDISVGIGRVKHRFVQSLSAGIRLDCISAVSGVCRVIFKRYAVCGGVGDRICPVVVRSDHIKVRKALLLELVTEIFAVAVVSVDIAMCDGIAHRQDAHRFCR